MSLVLEYTRTVKCLGPESLRIIPQVFSKNGVLWSVSTTLETFETLTESLEIIDIDYTPLGFIGQKLGLYVSLQLT